MKMMKLISLILLAVLLINALSVFAWAEGDTTDVSSSQNAESDTLSVLTDNQQIIFLLSMVCGMLIALSFNFWKW